MTTPQRSTLDTILAGLLGVASGDALGATVEFLRPAEIQRRHNVQRDIIGGGPFRWRPGQPTDDTDLTMAVANGYINANADPAKILFAVSAEMVDWYNTHPRDIGGTTRAALASLAAGTDPTQTGQTDESSCGNGSLMRALPTALVRAYNTELRQSETIAISGVTHAHDRCVDACLAYNEIAASLFRGETITDALAAAHSISDLDTTVRAALATPGSAPVAELQTTGYVIDSLACAVWAIQQTDSLEDTLVALVNRGDDADTTAAIAGGLLGILHGPEALPHRWTSALETREQLTTMANCLAAIADHPRLESSANAN